MYCSTEVHIACFVAMVFGSSLSAADPIAVIPPPKGGWAGSSQGFGFANNSDVIFARYSRRSDGAGNLVLYSADGKEIASQEFARGRLSGVGDSHAGVVRDKNGEWVGICSGCELMYFSTSKREAPKPRPLAGGILSSTTANNLSACRDGGFFSALVGQEGFFVSRWGTEPRPTAKTILRPSKLDHEAYYASVSALNGTAECFAITTGVSHAAGDTYFLNAWSLKGKEPIKIVETTECRASCLRIQDDGKRIFAGFSDGSLAWYDIKSWEKREVEKSKSIATGRFSVSGIDVHPTGKCLACVTFDKSNLPNLFTLSTETGEILSKVAVHKIGQNAVAFNPSGTKLATFGGDGTIRVYDARPLLKLDEQ